MKYILLLLLSASAHAVPLVQPQDVALSSFSFKAVSVGTNTLPAEALTVYGIVASSTTVPTISCTAGTGVVTAGSTSQAGSFAAGVAATACTLTFTVPFISSPFCVCQNTVALATYASAYSKTSVTCTAATALTGDTITYWCWGPP